MRASSGNPVEAMRGTSGTLGELGMVNASTRGVVKGDWPKNKLCATLVVMNGRLGDSATKESWGEKPRPWLEGSIGVRGTIMANSR